MRRRRERGEAGEGEERERERTRGRAELSVIKEYVLIVGNISVNLVSKLLLLSK
jgi:hypothetical protein